MKLFSVFDINGTGIKANDQVEVLDIDHEDGVITVLDPHEGRWISLDSSVFVDKLDKSPEMRMIQSAISAAQKAVIAHAYGPIDDFPYGTSRVKIGPVNNSKFFKLLSQFGIGIPSDDASEWIVDNPGDSFMLSLKSKEVGAKAFATAIDNIRTKNKKISIRVESIEV